MLLFVCGNSDRRFGVECPAAALKPFEVPYVTVGRNERREGAIRIRITGLKSGAAPSRGSRVR
jgi:hypothetical protein